MRSFEEMEAIKKSFEEGRSQGFREAARALSHIVDTGLWDEAFKTLRRCRRQKETVPYEVSALVCALRRAGISPYGELCRRWTASTPEDLDNFDLAEGWVIHSYPVEVSTVGFGWRFKDTILRMPLVAPYNPDYNPDFDWGE